MLNHIFCKKKKELHPSQQTDLSQECQLKEETSEVDDIITMFECVTELRDESENTSAVRKRNNESEKVHLVEDTSSKDLQSLPPIRTQSLPPITLGKSLLVNSQTLAHRTSGAHVAGHLAHRSQKSKSEHDLFDGKSKDQKAAGSSQILTHKAWISTPSEQLLDKLLHGSSSPLDVLCSNHTPYIQRNDQAHNHLFPLRVRESALTRNSLAPIRDHCTHRFSLPPDQVSQGVKKSKSSLGAGLAVLPPPFASKLHRAGIPQSQSLSSFPPPLTGEPLRNIQVLPAIPPQRKRSPSPLTTQNLSDNRN
ncbi:hypothetical protein cypCar_00049664 [Cyprinus carpio]|nr:hypothetical protein cypCar_00049664 [Cyprinus carpio]